MTLAKKSLSDMLVGSSSTADIAAAAAAAARPDDAPEPQRLSVVAEPAPPYSSPVGAAPEDKAAAADREDPPAPDTAPDTASAEVATEQPATEPSSSSTPKTFARSRSGARTTAPSKAAPTPEPPKYMTFTRKEARLRDDQIDDLSMLARKLARASRGGDERITDNTLIRVAVDLLLAQSKKVQGSTEEDIRNSLMR